MRWHLQRALLCDKVKRNKVAEQKGKMHFQSPEIHFFRMHSPKMHANASHLFCPGKANYHRETWNGVYVEFLKITWKPKKKTKARVRDLGFAFSNFSFFFDF